jgi:putative polymerase
VRSWVKQDAFVSGLRQGGRNLFPILGNLRVSSVFLEPVSMGNYATIVGLWALSFDTKDRREAMKHFLVCLVLIVACDSRFASILVLLLLALRVMPMFQNRFFVLILPLVAVGGLILLALAGVGSDHQDNLAGRLMHSGQAVLDLGFLQLLGMGKLDYLGDMGIAYALEYFGLFLCLVLWICFAAPRLKDERANRYRLMMAVYCLGILSVSGTSFYSAKTSVIGWFLYGVLYAKKSDHPVLAEAR